MDLEAAAVARAGHEGAAKHRHPLVHADEALPAGTARGVGREPAAPLSTTLSSRRRGP